MLKKTLFALALLASTTAHAVTIVWTDWTSAPPGAGSAQGTIAAPGGNIGVADVAGPPSLPEPGTLALLGLGLAGLAATRRRKA